ncbi:MAG: hypothetical protein ABEH77_07415 [Halobacteriaceae archaeon]
MPDRAVELSQTTYEQLRRFSGGEECAERAIRELLARRDQRSGWPSNDYY